MGTLLKKYFSISIIYKLFFAFVIGSLVGIFLWYASGTWGLEIEAGLNQYAKPFGKVFVNMLKMIVIPVVFFSLVVGAASLPLSKFGRVGAKVILWYLFTSLLAAFIGVIIALQVNPGKDTKLDWKKMAVGIKTQQVEKITAQAKERKGIADVFVNMFKNPFESLSNGNFLAMIVFAILFGLASRMVIEKTDKDEIKARLEQLLEIFKAINDVMFKMVDWILEYAPIGVFALSIVNFGIYGPEIVGPYIQVVGGVILGVLLMIFVIYSLLLFFWGKKNPLVFLKILSKQC